MKIGLGYFHVSIKSAQEPAQLDGFADAMRDLLCRIREVHGADCEIHLFPAIPAAVAVKLGQLLLPKADPPIHIYDHNPR
jgi:SMODS-associated and fused to various effectors sensor domain